MHPATFSPRNSHGRHLMLLLVVVLHVVLGNTVGARTPQLAATDASVMPLFSWETGTDGWTPTSSVVRTTDFHIDGAWGLKLTNTSGGGWRGAVLPQALDLSAVTRLRFDVKTGATGTTGNIAFQVGDAWQWCELPTWSWIDPNTTATIDTDLTQNFKCNGVVQPMARARIRAIYVYYGTGVFWQDNFRADRPAAVTPASGAFVTRSGTQFMRNEQPFRFVGTNNYYLPYKSRFMVDDLLATAARQQFTVIRSSAFLDIGNSDGSNSIDAKKEGVYFQYWNGAAPAYNDGADGLQHLDYLVYRAKQLNLHVVLPFTNNWQYYGGMDQYVRWRGGQYHDQFYTDATIRQWYKNYITHLLNRVNPLTGIAYKDDPTIMAWQLANEPRCGGSGAYPTSSACSTTTITNWVAEMSAYVKSVDSNHLVSVGDEGFFCQATPNNGEWTTNCSTGVDALAYLDLPNIDYMNAHLYPDAWGKTVDWGTQWITDHIKAAHGKNKPMVLGEFGLPDRSADQATRNAAYRTWLAALVTQGGNGALLWMLAGQQDDGTLYMYPDTDGLLVYCPSTVCSTVATYAAQIRTSGLSAPSPTPAPTATPTPTPAPPANVADASLKIEVPLVLNRTSVAPGEQITGQVTYANTGAQPVALRNLVIAGRPPGGTNGGGPYLDFAPGNGAVTVAPGARVTLQGSRTIRADDPLGTWYAFSSYQDDQGTWHDAPATFNRAFTVRLPLVTTPTPAPQTDAVVTIDRTRPDGTSKLAVGVTHTKEGLNATGDPDAHARAITYLGQAVRFTNRHIYGWGARNPNPAPGVYDWTDLDKLVATERSLGSTLVLTIGMAPEWMTANPQPTSNGEPRYDQAPTPAHYDDFAELARQVARRYPDVHYFQVWNEMKGIAYPYTDYTALYNKVYDALKDVNPQNQVGGFYLTLTGNSGNQDAPLAQWELDIFDQWLRNAHGADFVCLDGALSHALVPYDSPTPPGMDQLMALTKRYEGMTRQIRARTALPIWWSEDYLDPNEGREATYAPNDFQAAGLASILLHELRGGANVSLRWGPIGNNYYATVGQNPNVESLLSDVDIPGGGQPYPSYWAYRAFTEQFAPGTQLYAATSSSPNVEVLASATATLLINKRSVPTTVSVNNQVITLARYEVRVLR